jgi:CubicO group peptidase (beta-lactamase class C family)
MPKTLGAILAIAFFFVLPADGQVKKKESKSTSNSSAVLNPAQKPALDGLDQFIEQVMKDWKVPGLGISVVQDGKVILTKGYGYRDVDKKLPVTPTTLFCIASMTKSFVVTELGTLVDEGKLDWDKPVYDYLQDFRMYDPVVTERLTTRDLVTHRSGLPRHDLTWYSNADITRKELIKRLRYLAPNKDLRERFQYNNLMFMTAGYLGGVLNGTDWETAVHQRVLLPLSMTNTNFSVLDSQKTADFAEPYRKAKEEVKQVPFYVQGAVGPAGEINTTADDIGHYLLFQLNKGKYGDKQILSENNAIQMQSPQMVVPGAPRFPELGESSYGMGFGVTHYRGHKMVNHGGAIDGFRSEIAFLPNEKIGVVVFVNLDGTAMPNVVVYNVLDRLLGLEPVPWNRRFLDIEEKEKQSEEEGKKQGFTAPKSGTHPSHDLKDYVGEYENPGYGRVTIEAQGDGFQMKINRLSAPLKHFHYDVFAVPEDPLDPLEKEKVMFHSDVKGDITSLSMAAEPNVSDIVFTRVAEARMREKSFLEPFTGQYELPGNVLNVALRGEHALVASTPGQPPRELIPQHGMFFDLQGLSGVSIEFKPDASGKVTEAVFYQGGDALVIKKK